MSSDHVPVSGPEPTENALLYGVGLSSLLLTLFLVLMRLYAKRYLSRQKYLVVEDYLIIIAQMTYISMCALLIPMANNGMGKPMWDVTAAQFNRASNLVEIWSVLYNIAAVLVKTAILFQILRVFVPQRQLNITLFISCYVVITIIFLFYTIMAIFIILMYTRGQSNWSPSSSGIEEFVVNGQSSFITGIFNAVSDFAILLLPLPSIFRLHITWRQKLAVTGLFATGFIACTISTVRAAISSVLDQGTDTSWTMAKEAVFALSEIAIAIVTFCLPASPLILSAIREKYHKSASPQDEPMVHAHRPSFPHGTTHSKDAFLATTSEMSWNRAGTSDWTQESSHSGSSYNETNVEREIMHIT